MALSWVKAVSSTEGCEARAWFRSHFSSGGAGHWPLASSSDINSFENVFEDCVTIDCSHGGDLVHWSK